MSRQLVSLKHMGGQVSCDGESSFPRWHLWVGEMMGKEAVVIGIKESELQIRTGCVAIQAVAMRLGS